MSIGNQFPPWQAPFGPTTLFTVFCSSVLCPRMALLLQSFRDVALSYVHGVYAHWQIDLILDRIRSFLGPADLQMMLCKLQEPCPVESNTEPGTMERTWSSAPSTPRRFRLSRCLQVAGIGQSTEPPRNSDDLCFDDIPVDGDWTMMVYEHGRTTPTFGYGYNQMLQWWR